MPRRLKMRPFPNAPSACVLAIGGIDPGGGAGLAADIRGAGAAGAFGCCVAALVTVQSTSGLRSSVTLQAKDVLAQAREVIRNQRVRAIKTGALGSAANVRAVAGLVARYRDVPAIVDPVMLPSRGRGRLLAERALVAMRSALVPRAALVIANVPEAEALTGKRVTNVSEAHDAALALCKLGAEAAIVKGGHMAGPQAIDVLVLRGADGAARQVIEIRARRLRLPPIHGGGCTFAALVAGRIAADAREYRDARADIVLEAVRWAKREHHRMLAGARDVGGEMRVLVP
jgi:hydroxymethylpyrimidine kinase/phosphomethylpyrimidine kinase